MSDGPRRGLLGRARDLFYARDGRLTSELERTDGGHGLGQVPLRLKPTATTTMICGFCSTGCGLEVHLRDGVAVNLSPARGYPVNRGTACPKGWEALTPLAADDRASRPLLRNARGDLEPVGWKVALETFSTRIKAVQQKYGPDSVAWLGTGQLPTEELALLGSLAKFGMGVIHGDGNTRQCMATSAVAYKQAFGFDAPPFTYQDFEDSDVMVFIGANPCIAHPILWERVCRNRRSPEIVVIDPRRTETAMAATLHLPLKPKSDLVLLYGLAQLLIQNDDLDRDFIAAHTEGFDAYAAHVAQFTPERVAEATGIDIAALEHLARSIGKKGEKRVSFWWTMGVNQSHEGVRTAQAIIALTLMTGNIGKPGTGPNSITGQCNAMGSRIFSNTTSLLGGRDFKNAAHRQEVAGILGFDAARVPDRDSLAYDQIMEGILRDKIKALWVIATNTAHSWINQADARDTLARLDFLVVQDMYSTTDTAKLAHLVLPAAAWGEKDGCFINSERRIGRIRPVRTPPGEARTDFQIFKGIADAWGCSDVVKRFESPEATFRLLQELSRGRPCDITGIDGYAMLDENGGVQWPAPAGETREPLEHRRLFADGRFFTEDQRARFLFAEPRALPEAPSERFPLLLLTGRGSSAQWHTGTRTDKSPVLRKLHSAVPYVEVSPVDAEKLGLGPTDWVRVRSPRGEALVRAFITHVVQPGQVFMPMHHASTNQLTFAAFDPFSRQPSYKACAVRLERLAPGERPS